MSDEGKHSLTHLEDTKSLCATSDLFHIPWEDVLFKAVYPLLNLQCLFQLRSVCRLGYESVMEYFRCAKEINLIQVGSNFNVAVFKLVTEDNTSIRKLLLRNCKSWLSDKELVPLLQANSHLQNIDLTNCIHISDASLQSLAVSCPALSVLKLGDCSWLSSSVVGELGMHCTLLEHVDLTGCWDVKDAAIIGLTTKCTRLKFLSISKIYGLTDQSVNAIAKNCKQLFFLNLRGCWRVTDDSVRLLGEYCPSLTMLQVRECRDVTERSLCQLRLRGIRVDIPQKKYQMDETYSDYLQRLHGLNV